MNNNEQHVYLSKFEDHLPVIDRKRFQELHQAMSFVHEELGVSPRCSLGWNVQIEPGENAPDFYYLERNGESYHIETAARARAAWVEECWEGNNPKPLEGSNQ